MSNKKAIELLEKAKTMMLGGKPEQPEGYSYQRLYDWISEALAELAKQPPAAGGRKRR